MKLTAEDLAANPRLRQAVTKAAARDLDEDRARRARPARPSPAVSGGRAGLACARCGRQASSLADAERHADTTGHANITNILTTQSDTP